MLVVWWFRDCLGASGWLCLFSSWAPSAENVLRMVLSRRKSRTWSCLSLESTPNCISVTKQRSERFFGCHAEGSRATQIAITKLSSGSAHRIIEWQLLNSRVSNYAKQCAHAGNIQYHRLQGNKNIVPRAILVYVRPSSQSPRGGHPSMQKKKNTFYSTAPTRNRDVPV